MLILKRNFSVENPKRTKHIWCPKLQKEPKTPLNLYMLFVENQVENQINVQLCFVSS